MKPDKHKQKKQNDYKRKHGITNKTSKSETKLDKEKSINEDQQRASGNSKTEIDSDPSQAGQELHNIQSTNEENDIEFEEIEDLETGEDLNDILKDTANTMFQYQYHRDSFFEEIGDYACFDDKCADVVSIQPSILSQILLGLPLYKRLDLEESMFEEEDLVKMQAEAEKHISNRNPQQNQFQTSNKELLSEEMFESSSSSSLNGGTPRRKNPISGGTSNILETESTFKTGPRIADAKQDSIPKPKVVNPVAPNSLPHAKQSTTKPTKTIQPSKKSTMAELEDELDALLKM